MTPSDPRHASSLDVELKAMYRPMGPPTGLAERIDERVSAALTGYRHPRAGSRRRTLVLAAGLSLLAVTALAGGAVAQRLASGCGITIVGGISFSDCVVGRPGLTNIGQPFWGTDILERKPAEAAEMAAEKGFTVRWQVEDWRGTESLEDDVTRFSDEPPACGRIDGGSVFEAGHIQLVVTIDDPLTPGSQC